MMETATALEQKHAHALAEEYRHKGYEVIETPGQEQLPEFLSGYHPDLLIRKDNEATVVEVKTRSSLIKDPRLKDLARILLAKQGWNFELVILGEEVQLDTPEGAISFEKGDIRQGLETAKQLLTSGASEAALLIAWSRVEAIVRLIAEEEDVKLNQLAPSYILKQAVTNGLISREDYEFLTRIMKYRNAVAHGFKTTDLDSMLVSSLIDTAERILQTEVSPES
jgi:uncharacterized protein YutE (UPF0331/DUF86 family)